MNERKKYTKEFKCDAVSLVLDQGYTKTEAAVSLGLRPSLVSRWVVEYQKDDKLAFRGNGKLTPAQAETRALKMEIRQLKMEKDILKKAAVFFAKETK